MHFMPHKGRIVRGAFNSGGPWRQTYLCIPLPFVQLPPWIRFGRECEVRSFDLARRRLHAKLVAWESLNESGCLVGSANFTAAAFDSRNVETCLLVSEAKDFIRSLFDKELGKKPIAFEDFEPGAEQEPGTVDESASLRLLSALLSTDGQFRVAYRH